MTTSINITESGFVQVVETTIKSESPLGDFVKELSKDQPISTGLLPLDCVGYERGQTATKYLIQRSPRWQEIEHDRGTSRVYLPWVFIEVSVSGSTGVGARMYFGDGPLHAEDTEVYYSWLPNTYESGELCLGTVANISQDNEEEEFAIVNKIVTGIFSAVFNNDLDACVEYVPRSILDLIDHYLDDEYGTHPDERDDYEDYEDEDEFAACTFKRSLNPYETWCRQAPEDEIESHLMKILKSQGHTPYDNVLESWI